MKTDNYFCIGPRLILGLSVIALGVLFLLDNFHLASVHDVLYYWPAVLIIFGVSHFFHHRTMGGSAWSFFLIFIGSGMLLDRIYGIDFHVWSYWPVLLVFFGASMILDSLRSRRPGTVNAESGEDSFIKSSAILGGIKRNVYSKNFRGGELTAVMGGIDLDLRDSQIVDEAVIIVEAVMGGVEIKVPEEWRVIIEGNPILGGFSNETHTPSDEHAKRLFIRGTVVMGGVEIRNTSESSWDHHHDHFSKNNWRHDDIR
jgi:predicted membrane protein